MTKQTTGYWQATVLFLFAALLAGYSSNSPANDTQHYSLDKLLDLPLQDLLKLQVTVASRFAETPLETGSTSSVITPPQWQAMGARRFKDALDNQPGILVLPNWFGAEPVYIRGYAEQNNNNGVAVLLDGVALNLLEGSAQFTRQNINLGILDRIELIRGPGSALYGDTAFHGVLALSAFETRDDLALFNLSYAGNGYHDGAIKYSRALNSHDRISVALASSGQLAQNQTYQYFDSNGNIAESERDLIYTTTSMSVKYLHKLNAKNQIYLRLYWDDNRYDDFYSSGTTPYLEFGAPEPSSVAADDTGGVDSQFAMLQVGGMFHLSRVHEMEVKLYTNKSKRDFDRKIQHKVGTTDGSDTSFEGIGNLHGIGDGEYTSGINVILKQKRVGNFRYSVDFTNKRTHMGNFNVTQTDASGDIWTNPPGTITFDKARLNFSDYRRVTSGIGVDSATFLKRDRFILHLGGRYDHYSDFGNVFSPRAAIIYRSDKHNSLKLLYGNAFRAPAAGELKGFANNIENPDLQAETIDTYELSYQRQGKRWAQEYVFFKSFWHDAITSVYPYYDNSGNSTAYGAEANIKYNINSWRWQSSFSYVRSHNDKTQQEYIAFPKWIVNFGVSHVDSETKTLMQINNRVHLGAYEANVSPDSLPDPKPLKDYWRMDFHASRPWNKDAGMSFDIRNVFDRKNFLPSVQEQPSTGGLPDEGRSMKVGMYIHW